MTALTRMLLAGANFDAIEPPDWSKIFVHSTTAVMTSGSAFGNAHQWELAMARCRCAECDRHDVNERRRLARNHDLARIHQAHQQNYLEQTIRRLDRAIERVRRFAA